MRRLLLTGVPGWLTNAFIENVLKAPPNGLEELRCLTMSGSLAFETQRSSVRITAVEGRLELPESLARAADGCDTVLHAAGILHVKRTQEWYAVNTKGTEALMQAAERAGVGRFVLVSSNAAAGRATSRDALMRETDKPNPLSHYGRSKLLAEQALLSSKLDGVVLRPCMFYGPPVPARHVDIYRRILSGRMPMVGRGDYARSVTHISNLVQGCLLALSHPRASGQVYYIADAQVYTTKSIVDAMAAALGVEPRFFRLPAASAKLAYIGDRLLASLGAYWQNLHLVGEADWHVGVSIDKARSELGYTPTVGLAEGMVEAVAWCRSRRLL